MLTTTESLRRTEHAVLNHSKVFRGGKKDKKGGKDHETEFIEVGLVYSGGKSVGLSVGFSIASKGGGETDISVHVGPQDFPTILALMSAADRQATLRALAEELRFQIYQESK
jgi:hypothetical protein